MTAIFTRKKTWTVFLLLAGLAGFGWWQRQPILAWYYVQQLSGANQENRAACAKRVASLENAAVPRLLEGLGNPDATVCANMQLPLLLMLQSWGLENSRAQELVEQVWNEFDKFSPAGQEQAVLLLAGMLQRDVPKPALPRLTRVVSAVLIAAEKKHELRQAALLLAAELVESVQPGQWVDVCGAMAERGLKDDRAATRVAALQLLMREPMRKDKELLEKTIPFLRDSDANVRKAVLLVLAKERDLVREESFLPLLHDENAEVQYLCEMALRERGLRDDDIDVARMISAADPAMRMRVLARLQRMPDANLCEWLRQLSADPAPAVRAAAVRAAGENPQVDLSARLREMAEQDPSETVRQNARYYLQQRTARVTLD